MGFYSDNFAKNPGLHVFDAGALTVLSQGRKVEAEPTKTDSGDVVSVKAVDDSVTVLDKVLVHQSGRQGNRDLTKDAVIIPTEKLLAMSDADQDAIVAFERIAPGENGGRRDTSKKLDSAIAAKDGG